MKRLHWDRRLLLSVSILLIADAPVPIIPIRQSAQIDLAPLVSPPPTPLAKTLSPVRSGRHKPSPTEQSIHEAMQAATQEPRLHGYLNAVQVYPFADGMIYRVYAAPERITDLALQPGEALGSVAAGDTVRWVIGDTSSGSGSDKRTHILLKPFTAGLSTNLVITTDRRSYHLSLSSTVATAMSAVSWTYPQDALIALKHAKDVADASAPGAAALSVDQLEFGYIISGDSPDWRPVRAFDDGRQTFIEFPASLSVGEAPPLFILGAKGEAELVNYRVRGHFYIVDRLFTAAELRLGTTHQDVVRITRRVGAPAVRRGRRAV
jgi:type IV secretion system protein VirB9